MGPSLVTKGLVRTALPSARKQTSTVRLRESCTQPEGRASWPTAPVRQPRAAPRLRVPNGAPVGPPEPCSGFAVPSGPAHEHEDVRFPHGMKVILNSDILYHRGTLVRELGRGLKELFEACIANDHEIVIPLTSKLEFDRHQREEAEEERRRLRAAYALLDNYHIDHGADDPGSAIVEPDLLALVSASGVKVTELPPDGTALADAHERAALHLPPHPPKSKSDEMRDLVIWSQSLGLARGDPDGALLISRDEVHVHPRGDAEAFGAGLVRVSSVEEALEFFEVRTPAGRIIEDLLRRAWAGLTAHENALPQAVVVKRVSNATFRQGEGSIDRASASIRATAGESVLESVAWFTLDRGVLVNAELSDVRFDGAEMGSMAASLNLPIETLVAVPADDDIASLREVLGE